MANFELTSNEKNVITVCALRKATNKNCYDCIYSTNMGRLSCKKILARLNQKSCTDCNRPSDYNNYFN